MEYGTRIAEGLPGTHYYAARQRARLWAEQEILPFVDLIVRVRLQARPSYVWTDSALRQVSDGLDESQRSIVRQCEDRIAEIMSQAEKMASAA